jgi:hypothetical protein
LVCNYGEKSVVEKFLEDFGDSGEEAYRLVGCRDRNRSRFGNVLSTL